MRGDSSLLAVLLVIRLLPTCASCALAPQACAVLLRQWRAAFAFRMDRCTSDVDDLLDSFCGLPTPGTPGSSDPPSQVANTIQEVTPPAKRTWALGPGSGSSELSSYVDSNYGGEDKCSDTDTMEDLGYDRGHLVDHDLDQPARHFVRTYAGGRSSCMECMS